MRLRNFNEGLSKLEYQFNEIFNDQISTISYYAKSDEPLLLREVLTMGFNNVILNGTRGWSEEDFTEEELNTPVTFDSWEYDQDNYRIVYLSTIEN